MAYPACPSGPDDYPERRTLRTWQAHGSLLSWALDELFKPGLQIKPVAAQLLAGTPPTDSGSGAAAERAIKKARAAARAVARGSGGECTCHHSRADQRGQQEPATPPNGCQAARRRCRGPGGSCNVNPCLD